MRKLKSIKSIKSMRKNKRKKLVSAAVAGVLLIAVVAGLIWQNGMYADAAPTVDDSTLGKWEETTGKDTKNIGRIWTDKSVFTEDVKLPGGSEPEVAKGDSDFLVSLSALSSAGSITGETISTKPLDIVLVLDTSGSMDNSMGGYTYVPTYNVRENGRTAYYAEVDGEYVNVDRIENQNDRFDHWEVNGQTVEPKTNANDNETGHIQFYTYSSVTKMDALKTAATSFVNSTLAENKEISDPNKQHSISLVTFAGSANTRHQLTTVTTENAAQINGTINSLDADGATAADYAMNNTKTVLNSAREDAQKVVIFFTDGEPNHWSGFDGDVANDAIAVAKDLKAADTKIYSIGMFSDANPDDTDNRFNAYMHGMSSNYPDASSYTNLGERAKNADGTDTAYYKKASDSEELNKVFDEIFKEISSIEASSPFENGSGLNGENMEAVTFHDELGDYMKVDGFKTIVFADNTYTDPKVTSVDGEDKKIIKYEFTGGAGGNVIYPDGDLSKIEITVERYNDPAKGDVVTVTIPASMIPLREYVVDTTGQKSMTIDDTFPLRIFYGASLKDEAKTLLANPDKAMQDYIAANKNDENQVNFYSNKYYKDGSNNGGVYVEFEPNDTNDFYYFQENERLFLDKECTEPAAGTELDQNEIYYYDRLYYAMEGDKPVEKHNYVEIPGSSNLVLAGFVKSDAEGLYIPSGTPRTTSLATHALNKETNTTNTAPYVTAPDWDDIHNPKNVIVKLGNNGLLPVDMPGTLEVTKKVTADEGLTAPTDAEFDFTLELTAPANGSLKESYKAQKFDKNDDPVGEEFTIADGGTFKLTADQTVRVYGLEDGVDYKVTEAEHQGFTTTKTGDSGEIIKNQTATATFTNNYEVEDLIIHAEDFGLKGTKNITGRDFESGDAFRFEIKASALAETSPLPTNATEEIEPTNGTSAEISFGDFTFDKPGHYRYTISEFLPNGDDTAADKFDKVLPGMTYDTTEYRLVVDVTDDNGDGKLELKNLEIAKRTSPAAANWETLYSNAGGGLPTQDYLNFTNTYSVDTQDISLVGTKVLENKSFADYGDKGQFGFKIEAKGSRAVDSEASVEWTEDAGQPMPTASGSDHGNNVFANSTTGVISIPGITFGHDEVGKEYRYEIKELQPLDKDTGAPLEGAEQNSDGKWVYNGITLDNSTKEIIIKVKSTTVNNQEVIQATVTGNNFTFTNTYNAETDYTFSGEKTITNRDFKDGDTFTFKVEPQNGAPAPEKDTVTIEPKDGSEVAVSFGNIHFTQNDVKDAAIQADGSRSKTFTYRVWEEKGGIAGIDYDSTAKTVKITVTDDGEGNLTAEAAADSAALEWENVYEASMTYSTGIDVRKTLTGRNMKAGEFDFTITPQDGTPAVADSDANFKNGASLAGTANKMNKLSSLKFTQDDAGKTYTYIIDEKEPADDNAEKDGIQKDGVTYDQSQYKVTIEVTDNGDGTMKADTTVKRIKDDNGQTVDEEVAIDEIAFNNSYAAGPGTLDGSTALAVTKNFTGRENNKWLESDKFTFEIKLVGAENGGDVSAVTMPAQTRITIDAADEDHKVSFGDIKFSKTGTYIFEVSEDTTGLSDKGITAKTEPRTVKIVVTDPGDGTLAAVKDGTNSDALFFENTYEASATTFEKINVEKVLKGRPSGKWLDTDAFEFKLEAGDEDTKAAIENASVKLPEDTSIEIKNDDTKTTDGYSESFGAITFTRAGEYSFKVTEVEGDIGGIKYDSHEEIVTIKVTDGDNGSLVAKVITDEGTAEETTLTFENTYEVTTTATVSTANLFTKAIDGRDWLGTDEFTFTIKPLDGAPEPKNGTKVTVKSDSAKDNEKVKFDFGDIEFEYADLDGAQSKVFTYEITENDVDQDKMPGVTKDNHTVTVEITLADADNGKITAAVTRITGSQDFVNTYSTTLDYNAKVDFDIAKTLKGRDMEAGQFEFTVKPADAASAEKLGLPADGKVVESIAKVMGEKATMPIEFNGSKDFNQKDDGKTYSFTVTETKGGGEGYTNDSKPVTVTITTKHDPATAGLTITTTVTKDGKEISKTETTAAADTKTIEIPFENAYDGGTVILGGEGEVKINAEKTLTGRDLQADEFKFVVTNGNEEVATGTNDADGNITFSAIKYDIEKLEQDVKDGKATAEKPAGGAYVYTYTYSVAEDKDSLPAGVTAVTNPFSITVKVTDGGKGKLDVAVTYPAESDKLQFENKYGDGEAAEIDISGKKKLTVLSGNNAPDITGKYTFNVTAADGTPMPEKTEAKNDSAGNVSFGKIKYTIADVFGDEGTGERTKEFTYTVTETGNLDGVDNDKAQSFKVTVTDNGDGTITATTDNGTDSLFEFDNKYSVDKITTSVTDQITIKKDLDGRKLNAEEFKFELVEGGKVVAKGTNNAEGKVTFDAITYEEAGTHTYTVREVDNNLGGITYDTNSYTITTVVTDNGKGKLTVEHTTAGEIVFKNTYKADPTSVTLGAAKVLKNGTLKDEQFTFVLKDSDGNVVSEAVNDANGGVTFKTLDFDKADTYKYTISETNDAQEYITYDETEYEVTITVKDDREGNLTAKVSYGDEESIVFINEYDEPEEPEPETPEEPDEPEKETEEEPKSDIPQTGDSSPVIPLAILMIASTVCVVEVLYIRRRRR